MLELVALPGAFGMRNVSPFCLKIEMLLSALELPFNLSFEADPRKAPKGKLPYLLVESKRLADSELIVEYLDELTKGKVYAGMTSAQKAQGVALARLLEDHLYWIMVASRWLDKDWFPNVAAAFFDVAPKLIRPLIASAARKQVERTYNLQGLGRHTLEEQKGFAHRDLAALQATVAELGDGRFLFGATPNVFDFTIAAMLAGIYDNQPATWLTPIAQRFGALQAYTERVQSEVGVFGRK